jgi:mannose-6-phosphate isomerase
MMKLYPLKFDPILKHNIWGGSEIGRFKNLHVQESGIGESWELSQVPESVSIVANGNLKGKSLTELIEAEPKALLGRSVHERFGNKFPLLIKFIDAEDDLSIQVHPNDELALQRHNSFGKTEMWYVINSKPGSKLITGFSKQIDKNEYERRIKNNSIEEVLQSFEVKAGDAFFLPAGRIHAIDSGLFLAEIQQSSDITYRLYDYNRKDAQGKCRELHTELAKDAIDYNLYSNMRTSYKPMENEAVLLVNCSYFTTNLIHLKIKKEISKEASAECKELERDYTSLESFVVYICMQGEGTISYGQNSSIPICQGETVLLPACIERTRLSTNTELLLLETFIL